MVQRKITYISNLEEEEEEKEDSEADPEPDVEGMEHNEHYNDPL